MTKVIGKSIREPHQDLFTHLQTVLKSKLTHNPLIVIEGDMVSVVREKSELILFTDQAVVLYTWKGNWSSDTFKFTLGELRKVFQ